MKLASISFLVLLSGLAICPRAGAVDLNHTPIQDAMQQSFMTVTWTNNTAVLADDEFSGESTDWSHAGHKSVWKAAALSALVPGAGQYYVGNRTKARYFFVGEALTWVGFAAFKIYGNWKEDDYIRFAARHANAQLDDKSDEFRDLVGFYQDIDEYNTFGRVFDPERPYLVDSPENHWRWQSFEDRETYRHLKNRAGEADRRAEFMIGVAIVSRIVSTIDAIRDARKINKQIKEDSFSRREKPEVKLSIRPFSNTAQVRLTLLTNF